MPGVTEALARLGVVTLAVPGPGVSPARSATPDARELPDGAGAGSRSHTHSKTCSEVQIFMVPAARARCPAATRDEEAQKFTGPAPSRPAGLAPRRRRRAQRWDARKCRPKASPSWARLRPRRRRPRLLGAAHSGPVPRAWRTLQGSVRRRRAG